MRLLESITDSMDMNLNKLWEMVEDRRAWPAMVHGDAEFDLVTEQQVPTTDKRHQRALQECCTDSICLLALTQSCPAL